MKKGKEDPPEREVEAKRDKVWRWDRQDKHMERNRRGV